MPNRSIKSTLKSSLNSLNAAYYVGIIGYPRVDNDFIPSKMKTDLFPHPPINKYRYPPIKIRNKKVKIQKETVILFLSVARIITPHMIEGVFDYIDYFFDDELEYRSKEAEQEALKLMSLLEQFIKENEISFADILLLRNNFYKNCYQAGVQSFFAVQGETIFISHGDQNRIKCEYLVSQRQQNQTREIEDTETHIFDSISDAIDAFDQKNNTKTEIAPQKKQKYRT